MKERPPTNFPQTEDLPQHFFKTKPLNNPSEDRIPSSSTNVTNSTEHLQNVDRGLP